MTHEPQSNETFTADAPQRQGLTPQARWMLLAMGILALLGIIMMLLHSRQAAPVIQTPPPVTTPGTPSPATPPPGTDTGTVQTGNVKDGNGSTGDTDTATVPSLGGTDPNDGTADPTIVPAAPTGINPNEALISLTNNPFRPIRIETPQGSQAAAPVAAVPPSGPVTIAQTHSSASDINGALNNPSNNPSVGAVSLSPIPGGNSGSKPAGSTDNSNGNTGGDNGSGSIPLPTLPTTVSVGPAQANTPTKPATPKPTATATTGIQKAGQGAGNGTGNGAGNTGTKTAPATPPQPPVIALNVPKNSTVTVPDTSSINAATGATTGAGTGAAGSTSTAGGDITQAPTTTPDVLTGADDGAGSSTGSTGTGSTSLDQSLRTHQLSFNAAVLGPVNTAVFRTDKGFVVAAVGQKIADTDIILKEVTATSATLALGNTTKTLQLDKQ